MSEVKRCECGAKYTENECPSCKKVEKVAKPEPKKK